MANYIQQCNKRQKTTTRDQQQSKTADAGEFFSGINKIDFKGDSAPYDDTLCYRYYNANERIHGRSMEEWIRPAISLTAFKYNGVDSCGKATFNRAWDDGISSIDNHKRYIKACFEFCTKLGVKHWTAFDRDLIPDSEAGEENSTAYCDEMVEYIQELQQRSGMKPLWIAPDLHSSPRFASGAATNSDCNILMQASQRVKKCLEISHKLNSECFLIWSAREGFESYINTDIHREMKHFARLLKMTSDFKERLGYRGQLLLQPSKNNSYWTETLNNINHMDHFNNMQRERSMIYPYIWDVTSGLCFLKYYNLDRFYKMCVRPGYQHCIGSIYNTTGCIEVSHYDDVFTVKEATLLMKNVIEQGGLQPGGITLNITPSRESVDAKDLFISYVRCIDNMARGLRVATKMITDQIFVKNVQQRYLSFYSGLGSRISNGEATLEECDEQVRKTQNQCNDNISSSRQEHWEVTFQNYINKNN